MNFISSRGRERNCHQLICHLLFIQLHCIFSCGFNVLIGNIFCWIFLTLNCCSCTGGNLQHGFRINSSLSLWKHFSPVKFGSTIKAGILFKINRLFKLFSFILLNCGVGEDSWESLDSKEIKPVNPGNQSWIFIGRTDSEAEAPVLWPPNAKNWLIGKDPNAGEDWKQEKKWTTEDEMVGGHHWLDGHEFEQALGVGDGQRSLACYSSRGPKESDTNKCLNWKYFHRLNIKYYTSIR